MKLWWICLVWLGGWGLAGTATATVERSAEYPLVGPDVFDPEADGAAQLQTGLAEAAATGRHVLVLLGANWCPWCHRFDALLRDTALQAYWERDYVVVRIDVNWKGASLRNPSLLERYRRPPQRGIPVLTLLDARGRVLANPDISRWEKKEPKAYDPARLHAFLAQWAPSTRTSPASP